MVSKCEELFNHSRNLKNVIRMRCQISQDHKDYVSARNDDMK